MAKPTPQPHTKPIDVFQVHDLPTIAKRIEKLVSDIDRRRRRKSDTMARVSMRTALHTVLPFVAAVPQRERIESILEAIGG